MPTVATEEITIGGKTYKVEPLVVETFQNLDNWAIEETRTSFQLDNQVLQWNALGTDPSQKAFGTMWYKKYLEGPTITIYDVRVMAVDNNQNNINVHLYGFIPDGVGVNTLLTTSPLRDGDNTEYYAFQNYRIHYVAPTMINPDNHDNQNIQNWQLRYRKCPQADNAPRIITLPITKKVNTESFQEMAYICDSQGYISTYIDDNLQITWNDRFNYFQQGYHALRTWQSVVQYKNFRIYKILEG